MRRWIAKGWTILSYVERGDMFDYALLLNLPPEVQNQTLAFYDAPTAPFRTSSISPNLWPSTARGLSRTICAFNGACCAGSAPCIWGCGAAARCPAWQKAEPDNGTPGYYHLFQRVFCGEGDSLLAELCAQWREHPSTQLDALLLRWCRQHQPDYFPLLVMAVEAREQVDINGEPLLYIPGTSARTCMLWAEALHGGALSLLSERFIARRLNYGAPAISEEHNQHPAGRCIRRRNGWQVPRSLKTRCYNN